MIASIDWGALATTAYASAAIGLGVLLVASLAVTASLRAQDSRGGAAAALNAVTIACVVALAAAVATGIYFMADK